MGSYQALGKSWTGFTRLAKRVPGSLCSRNWCRGRGVKRQCGKWSSALKLAAGGVGKQRWHASGGLMVTDVIRDKPYLFLGSRLKRLAEQMQGDQGDNRGSFGPSVRANCRDRGAAGYPSAEQPSGCPGPDGSDFRGPPGDSDIDEFGLPQSRFRCRLDHLGRIFRRE